VLNTASKIPLLTDPKEVPLIGCATRDSLGFAKMLQAGYWPIQSWDHGILSRWICFPPQPRNIHITVDRGHVDAGRWPFLRDLNFSVYSLSSHYFFVNPAIHLGRLESAFLGDNWLRTNLKENVSAELNVTSETPQLFGSRRRWHWVSGGKFIAFIIAPFGPKGGSASFM